MISKEVLASVLVEWRDALSFAEEHKRDIVVLDRDYRLGVPLTQAERLRAPVAVAQRMIEGLEAQIETSLGPRRSRGIIWEGRVFDWNERGGGNFRVSSRHVTPWFGSTISI